MYTSDMEVLSEEGHADVASLSQEFDVIRASKEGMESVLRQYTGQENPQIFDGKGMKSAWLAEPYFTKRHLLPIGGRRLRNIW